MYNLLQPNQSLLTHHQTLEITEYCFLLINEKDVIPTVHSYRKPIVFGWFKGMITECLVVKSGVRYYEWHVLPVTYLNSTFLIALNVSFCCDFHCQKKPYKVAYVLTAEVTVKNTKVSCWPEAASWVIIQNFGLKVSYQPRVNIHMCYIIWVCIYLGRMPSWIVLPVFFYQMHCRAFLYSYSSCHPL